MPMNKIEFSEEQKQYLREHYPTEAACDIARHFGVSYPVVTRIAKEMGLKKAESWSKGLYVNRYVKTYKHESYKNFRVA